MYEVQIRKIQLEDGKLFPEIAIVLKDTELAVARDFLTVEEAEKWIASYNIRYGKDFLILK